MRVQLASDFPRPEVFDHGTRVKNVAANINQNSAVEIDRACDVSAACGDRSGFAIVAGRRRCSISDMHDVDVVLFEYILGNIRRVGESVPATAPAENDKQAKFSAAAHQAQGKLRKAEFERERDARL